MKPRFAALAAVPALAAPAAAQDAAPLDERYFKAFYQENGLRDFARAETLYAEVAAAARAAKDAGTEAKAHLGRGRCLRVLGKAAEAKNAFEAALVLDPANEEARRALAAGDTPSGADRALRERIDALVYSLGGAQREQARGDLLRIGVRALPSLEKGLRSDEVGLVAGAASVLGILDAPGARAALARAIDDPKVVFPDTILKGLGAVVHGPADADPEGRRLLLRSILRVPDPRPREAALHALVGRGFADGETDAVAAVVAEGLAAEDDEGKALLLRAPWGESVQRALLPALRPLLSSPDVHLRRAALACFSGAPETMADGDAAAVRGVLGRWAPWDTWSAFAILDGRRAIPEPQRGETLSALLACDDAVIRQRALEYLRDGKDADRRWSPGALPGYLAGYRRALANGAADDDRELQEFACLLNGEAGKALGEDDLIDLAARCRGLPRCTGVMWTETYAAGAVLAKVREADPGTVSAAFLRGFRRLETPQRWSWVAAWMGVADEKFTPSLIQVLAADRGVPAGHGWAYDQLVARGKPRRIPATPDMLAAIGADLGRDDEFGVAARKLADLYAAPELADAVRGLIERFGVENRRDLLGLLVRCAGKEAAPDLRRQLALAQQDPRLQGDVLNVLVSCIGAEAVPDLREVLKGGPSETAQRLLVGLLGVDAVPDLLELAARTRVAHEVVVSRVTESHGDAPATYATKSRVPAPVMEGFLRGLPAERRTGPLLDVGLDLVSDKLRLDIILESLSSRDRDVLVQAVRGVRRFNATGLWPKVAPLLDHPDEAVRNEARETLEAIRKIRELKATFERFGEEGAGKAFDDAAGLAKSDDPARRRAAALAFGALGDPAGVAPLLRLVEDKDPAVRDAALAALERLGGGK